MPGGLSYLALAAAACGVWSGARRHDPVVDVLVAVVIAQIALTHGFLAGARRAFETQALAPRATLCVC